MLDQVYLAVLQLLAPWNLPCPQRWLCPCALPWGELIQINFLVQKIDHYGRRHSSIGHIALDRNWYHLRWGRPHHLEVSWDISASTKASEKPRHIKWTGIPPQQPRALWLDGSQSLVILLARHFNSRQNLTDTFEVAIHWYCPAKYRHRQENRTPTSETKHACHSDYHV